MSDVVEVEYKTVVAVSATALTSSGGLTILKQFLEYASERNETFFYVYVNDERKLKPSGNIKFISVGRFSWLERIYWDWRGLRDKCGSLRIDYVLSLQNTSINIENEQIIYLHQPLPFTNFKFSLFSKADFKFFLYQKFYKFFIFKYCRADTQFVVQTDWMKEAIVSEGKVLEGNISVIKPDINLPKCETNNSFTLKNDDYILLYPATPLVYKNHLLLIDVLNILSGLKMSKEVKLLVTFNKDDYPEFVNKASKLQVLHMIKFLGVIEYGELCKEYVSCDLLIFPSYVETLGLPLLEAACYGRKIICSDLPYSRDVLMGYDAVDFVQYDSSEKWAESIKRVLGSESEVIPFKHNDKENGWKYFFEKFNF
jgi:glycosyltransferase involved in cell wall biosynthesis